MQRTAALVFLGTIARTAFVSGGSLPRGVGPEFAKFYEVKDKFTCFGNHAITIRSSQLNDDSCDCPDGSDEPGTAACSYLDPLSPEQPLPASLSGTTNTTHALPGFWCENAGHIGGYIPFMYVNDGVCDYDLCCDGSEEYSGVSGIKCPNRCAEIGKAYRQIEEEKKKGKEKAAKRRRTLVKESKELRRRVEAKIVSLKDEIAGLEVKRDDLQKKFEEVERSEKSKVVKSDGQGGKLGVLLGLAKKRVNELRDTLDKVLDQRDDIEERVEELEGILKALKEDYNPNFNDEGVKEAVHAWEDYSAKVEGERKPKLIDSDILEILKEDGEGSGINWQEFEHEDATDTDIIYSLEAYLPSFAREYLHLKLNSLRIWLIENGILADNPTGSGTSRLVTAAREAFQAVADDVSTKQAALGKEEEDLNKDYGPDDIFRALKDRCVGVDIGEYEYELCWLGQTSQKSKNGHSKTNMGNYVRIDTETADEEEGSDGKGLGKGPRMVLRYENGQGCWNGPSRRTDVWLACAEVDEIWRVTEAEKCVYKMEVGTPAACEDLGEPNVPTKDEL